MTKFAELHKSLEKILEKIVKCFVMGSASVVDIAMVVEDKALTTSVSK